MKKNIYVAVLAFLTAGACTNAPEQEAFKLTGSLSGVQEGTIQLIRSNPADRTTEVIDSAVFQDGVFHLEGVLEEAEMVRVLINPGNWAFSVFLENSEQTIDADTTGARHYDYTDRGGPKGAEVVQFSVKGSQGQQVLQDLENAPENKAFKVIQEEISRRFDVESDSELKEKIREESREHAAKKYAWELAWIDSFSMANPAAPVGPYLLENYYKFNRSMPLDELTTRLAVFKAPADSSKYSKTLQDIARQRTALLPGNVAPDFTLLKPDSTTFTLSSLKGQYVLVDFWASWCKPCREAIPHWKEVYQKYHDQGFEILGVTNDSRWSDWFKALEVEKMPWIQVADEFPVKNMPAHIAQLYMIPFLPTYVLLDREGKIVLNGGTKAEIDQKLAEAFGQ